MFFRNPSNLGYPSFDDLSQHIQDIPKLNENKWDILARNNPNCDLSRDIQRQVCLPRLLPACGFSPLKKQQAGKSQV